MEQFSVQVKNIVSNTVRNVKVQCFDHYEAHKRICDKINLFREDIISIKDSRKNEVYNLQDGFLFEA